MPAIRRVVRSCALSAALLGALVVPGTVGAPAQAADAPAASSGTRATETTSAAVSRATVRRRKLTRAVGVAMNQRGDRYSYGAAGPHAFDCSGLIYYSYRKAGFKVPRTSGSQAGRTRRIAKKHMRKGDLMFFSSGGRVYHAGIFLRWRKGGAVMLHAPSTGRRVTVEKAWTSSWFGGTLRR